MKNLAEKPDFDGSARRKFADELSFRWKARFRIDAAFEREAKEFGHVRLSHSKAPV